MCPGLEPVLPSGRPCHATLPSPALKGGYGERNGGVGISLKDSKEAFDGKKNYCQ
jgi:hypothetical protein